MQSVRYILETLRYMYIYAGARCSHYIYPRIVANFLQLCVVIRHARNRKVSREIAK